MIYTAKNDRPSIEPDGCLESLPNCQMSHCILSNCARDQRSGFQKISTLVFENKDWCATLGGDGGSPGRMSSLKFSNFVVRVGGFVYGG